MPHCAVRSGAWLFVAADSMRAHRQAPCGRAWLAACRACQAAGARASWTPGSRVPHRRLRNWRCCLRWRDPDSRPAAHAAAVRLHEAAWTGSLQRNFIMSTIGSLRSPVLAANEVMSCLTIAASRHHAPLAPPVPVVHHLPAHCSKGPCSHRRPSERGWSRGVPSHRCLIVLRGQMVSAACSRGRYGCRDQAHRSASGC